VKFIRIIKIIAINLITFIVLLLIVNWACGFFLKNVAGNGREQLPNYEKDRDHARDIFHDYNSVQHQYEPFVGWKILPYTGKTLHIDQHGDRIHQAPASSADHKRSIVFLGGSTMWGEGSDDQHTIPALFNDKNSDFQVMNRAQLAYNSRQELDALITLYSKNVKPDVVVFYDGVNDAAFLCPSDIKELPAHRLVPLFRSKLYVKRSTFVKEALQKTFVENIVKLMSRISAKPEDSKALYDCLGESGKAEEIAEIMMKNWELAHEMVTARGGKFIAVLQPAAFIGNPKKDHLKLDSELGKNFAEVYKHIKQKIAERKHDWIFDLSDKFDGNDYIYIDFCHVSPNGNEIMATEISKLIQALPQ
jgi:hypothetical protein